MEGWSQGLLIPWHFWPITNGSQAVFCGAGDEESDTEMQVLGGGSEDH